MANAAQDLGAYNDDEDLYAAFRSRYKKPEDQQTQNAFGPEEHRQFVEEATARNPIVGTGLAAFAPVYSAVKALGFKAPGGTGEAKTSSASWAELGGAWTGYGAGLKKAFGKNK